MGELRATWDTSESDRICGVSGPDGAHRAPLTAIRLMEPDRQYQVSNKVPQQEEEEEKRNH